MTDLNDSTIIPADVAASLRDIIILPVALVESFVDDDGCQFDHNHSCQAHGYFFLEQGQPCPQFELKRRLALHHQAVNDRQEPS